MGVRYKQAMRAVLLAVFVVGCTPAVPTLAGFELPVERGSLSVRVKEKALVTGASGSQARAQAAVRSARARYEMQFGSWRITDGTQPWTEANQFAWDSLNASEGKGGYRDSAGTVVVSVEASATEGALALKVKAADPMVNRVSLSFACLPDDRFLGFGAQADGVDHRGHTVAAWTSEPGIGKRTVDDEYPEAWMLEGTRHASSYPMPTFLSNRGFIAVAESDARSVFELCTGDASTWRVEVWSNAFTLWLFHGDSPKAALSRATAGVLQRPARAPTMAFAPWNDAIFGPSEVRRIAKVLRDNDIPSSAIWTEDFRGGRENAMGYRLKEEWDLDRTLYPDAEAIAAELAAQGFDWQSYFNTFIVENERIFAEATAGDHFVKTSRGAPYLFDGVTFKPTGLADLSRPETREWVKRYLRLSLDQGFKGWMADYGEWLPHDAVLASGENALEAHNRYPTEWVRLNAEVLKERDPTGARLAFFSRAGWFGTNALAPVVWAGDQRTSFQRDDGLFTVIPMGINLGLAGVSTYAHDIAGYQSGTNPNSTKELFFRWTTLGALSPVMRTHHGIDPRDNWSFEKDAETLAHFGRWAKVHVSLFPYFDGLAKEAETTGVPIMRGLFLAYPDDAATWTLSDQYLLGQNLLVAPIVDEGAVKRAVHVPAGTWVALDGSGSVVGPVDVMATAPMSELPVWVRRGAVVPRLVDRVDTLLPAEPPTVDLDDVALERRVWWAPGGVDRFVERDGTTWVSEPAAAEAFSENGAPLPDCASPGQRGCVQRGGPRVVVRLAGQGPLVGEGGSLSIEGPARIIDVEVLSP
jgi:alpha-glucosidase (family GH31 glycosyl hydrolase)